MPRLITLAFLGSALLLGATNVAAQQAQPAIATVTSVAPIYVEPNVLPAPLRTAAVATRLEVLEEGVEWTRVRFGDPQFGPRVGFVETKRLKIEGPAHQPTDLSITTSAAQPSLEAKERGAIAQLATATSDVDASLPRHFVGRSGFTFDGGPLIGVEFSGDAVPVLQVYGSFDWHQDVRPTHLFSELGDLITRQFDVEYTVPAFIGVGGVKVIGPPAAVRPYGVVGGGLGHLTVKADVDEVDVTTFLIRRYVDAPDLLVTKGLFEFGGGVAFSAGRAYIDASYRFRKFIELGEPLNISGLYVGAGFSF